LHREQLFANCHHSFASFDAFNSFVELALMIRSAIENLLLGKIRQNEDINSEEGILLSAACFARKNLEKQFNVSVVVQVCQ